MKVNYIFLFSKESLQGEANIYLDKVLSLLLEVRAENYFYSNDFRIFN